MASQPQSYRAFTPEFLQYLDSRGGFPDDRTTRDWFQKRFGRGVKAEHLADARHGRYAPIRCISGLIEMLLQPDASAATFAAAAALKSFMAKRGLNPLGLDDLDRILSHVCMLVIAPSKKDAPSDTGGLWRGFVANFFTLPLKFLLHSTLRGCDPLSQDVNDSIEWMYIRFGQKILPDQRTSFKDAVSAAERAIGKPLSEYQANARDWHAQNPWSIVLAKGTRNTIAGMGIVLPVTESTYNDILEGRRCVDDIKPSDFQVPTSRLIILASVENPYTIRAQREEPTLALMACMAIQVAALMRADRTGERVFHWLSFAPSEITKPRLSNNGFVATGRKMAKTGFELYERVVDIDKKLHRATEETILLTSSNWCPPSPPLRDDAT